MMITPTKAAHSVKQAVGSSNSNPNDWAKSMEKMMTINSQRQHVVLLSTGGTISSRAQSGGAAVASDSGEEVLRSIQEELSCPVRVVEVFRQGSYLLTFDNMLSVCSRITEALADAAVLGVVVTHGTDTMEETAYLADLVHSDSRPVVFTGAQNSADSQVPDGPGNLMQAIAVASSAEARQHGVLIAFAGEIYPARGVRKVQTFDLQAFGNPDFGSAGSVSAGNKVTMGAPPVRQEPLPLPSPGGAGQRVDVVAAYPGADATLLEAAMEAGARGIVLQATGSGNANRDLCASVAKATASGIVVVTSTRVHAGPVVPVYGAGGGKDLLAAGAIPSGLLRPSQSLILLSLLLRLEVPRAAIGAHFARCGSRN